MDRLRAMQTFVQIADQGSLTRAADVMGSSLPSVVRALASLETHLGVRLFHRTTRRNSLTDEGRRYLESAREVLGAADAADAALTSQAQEPAGHLSITAPVLFGHMYVSPAIARFMRRYEQVSCSVLLYDRTVNLLDESVDVGIRLGPLADSSLVAYSLGHIRRVLVASPGYLQMHGKPRHPRELIGAPHVRGRIDDPAHLTFYEAGKKLSIAVKSRLEFNLVAPAIEACAQSMGFGVFHSYQVLPHVERGQLQIVLAEYEPPPGPVNVIYPHARLLPARTRVFVEWMKQEFAGLSL